MLRLGMEEDVPIESGLITKRIAAAQKAVEAQNFAARKHLLEYDDVMNKQRKAVYGMRRSLLEGGEMREKMLEYARGILQTFIDQKVPPESRPDQWDLPGLQTDVLNQYGVRIHVESLAGLTRDEIEERIFESIERRYKDKEALVGPEVMRDTERIVMLNVIDQQWKDHLLSMDHLKEGIGLRGYGQKDPLVEYKKESFILFEAMMDRIEEETIRYIFFLQAVEQSNFPYAPDDDDEDDDDLGEQQPVSVSAEQRQSAQNALTDFTRRIERKKEKELDAISMVGTGSTLQQQPTLKSNKVGRNELCPCGSGKKYKKCHGA
jgi:preprotein translocase subunit SecA